MQKTMLETSFVDKCAQGRSGRGGEASLWAFVIQSCLAKLRLPLVEPGPTSKIRRQSGRWLVRKDTYLANAGQPLQRTPATLGGQSDQPKSLTFDKLFFRAGLPLPRWIADTTPSSRSHVHSLQTTLETNTTANLLVALRFRSLISRRVDALIHNGDARYRLAGPCAPAGLRRSSRWHLYDLFYHLSQEESRYATAHTAQTKPSMLIFRSQCSRKRKPRAMVQAPSPAKYLSVAPAHGARSWGGEVTQGP